jgi:hypothetical protein
LGSTAAADIHDKNVGRHDTMAKIFEQHLAVTAAQTRDLYVELALRGQPLPGNAADSGCGALDVSRYRLPTQVGARRNDFSQFVLEPRVSNKNSDRIRGRRAIY